MRLGLAVDQRDAELAAQRVHVGMVGVDQLPADFERRLALGLGGDTSARRAASRAS